MVNVVEQLAGTLWMASRITSSSIVNFTSAITAMVNMSCAHLMAAKHNCISAQASSSTTIIIMWVGKSKSFVTGSIFIGKVKMYKDSFLWQLGI